MIGLTGKNAVANLLGSLSGPLVSLVMTPFYLRQIGLEGLGLVGLMTMITTVLGVFVAGASKTYQRDIASAFTDNPDELPGLVSGGLLLFAGLGLLLGLLVVSFGNSQIHQLAEGAGFGADVLDRTLALISLVLAARISLGAAAATLVALRDQIWPNLLGVAVVVLTAVASWLSLSIWPRVDVFYVCQAGGTVCGVLILTLRCRSVIRQKSIVRNSLRNMAAAWRTRVGSSGRISLVLILHEGLGVLITQIDRVLITALFPLSALGVYNLGANPSRFFSLSATPINTVTFPEMCRMVTGEYSKEKIGEYLGRITFVMSLILTAGLMILIPSAAGLMTVWLGEGNVPAAAPTCFILLSGGHLLLAMAGPAYNLTIAFGRVGYGIPKNLLSLLILPLIGYFASKVWGVAGAAAIWTLYGMNCTLVCGAVAYWRHASFKAGRKWIASATAAILSGIVIGFLLKYSGLHGWVGIALSIIVGAVGILGFVVGNIGLSPRKWMRILEADLFANSDPDASSILKRANQT